MTIFFWMIEYLASFAECLLCCIFCETFLDKEKAEDRKYQIILLSAVGAGVVILINGMKLFSFMNAMIVILMYTLLQFFMFRKKFGLTFITTLIYAVILSAVDFTVAYLVELILGADAQYTLNTQSMERVLCILLSKTILALIVITANRFCRNSLMLIKKYAVIMCVYSIFLLSLLFAIVELNINDGNAKMDLFLTAFFIASITIELLTFYFVVKMGESYEQKQKTELIEMQNNMLQKSLNETESAFKLWRNSVHDYKNNIIALTQLAEDGNVEEIRKYLQRENTLIDKKMFYIRTGNSVVDAIVNTKQNFAESQGIVFTVNAAIPEKCNIDDIDLANILGNLIDNAIEANLGEENPYIDVAIRQEKKFIVIKVVNKYRGELPTQIKSTKKDKLFHGIGLGSVKSIVQKYSGEFLMEKKDDAVVAEILLLNK